MKHLHARFVPVVDGGLPVLTDLPTDFSEVKYLSLGRERVAQRSDFQEGRANFMHHCPSCGGWIPGLPSSHTIDNLNGRARAGRRGTIATCKRCGDELAFMGVMS
jgi:hypothetical protein